MYVAQDIVHKLLTFVHAVESAIYLIECIIVFVMVYELLYGVYYAIHLLRAIVRAVLQKLTKQHHIHI